MGATNKPYYADYVNHALRFYASYPDGCPSKKETDVLNWNAVRKILSERSDQEREIVNYVYSNVKNDVRSNVQIISKLTGTKTLDIWKLLFEISHKIAEERGLI